MTKGWKDVEMEGIASAQFLMSIGASGCEASDAALSKGTTLSMSVGANQEPVGVPFRHV